jgi:excisionase family DNA binding protein
MITENTPSPYVPIEDVAKYFAVSISTVRAWLRQGHIPKTTYIKIGNTYRFNLTAIVERLTNAVALESADAATPSA